MSSKALLPSANRLTSATPSESNSLKAVEHELTPNQYRETFGLKSDYPMAAPNYAQQRRELAFRIGLGRPKEPAQRARKSTARLKPPKSRQSATTEAGS
jgi:hypothetical protein